MMNKRKQGADAEDQAAQYLLSKGYTIITRRYHAGSGELDIIALHGEVLVFVEVKSRTGTNWIAEEAVTYAKANHLFDAAERYANETGNTERQIRFDLIAIDGNGLRHFENAIQQ